MTGWFVGLYQTVLGELRVAVFQRARCLTFHLLLLQPKYSSAAVVGFLHTNTHITVSRRFYSLYPPRGGACSVTVVMALNMGCTDACCRLNILHEEVFVWLPQGFVPVIGHEGRPSMDLCRGYNEVKKMYLWKIQTHIVHFSGGVMIVGIDSAFQTCTQLRQKYNSFCWIKVGTFDVLFKNCICVFMLYLYIYIIFF